MDSITNFTTHYQILLKMINNKQLPNNFEIVPNNQMDYTLPTSVWNGSL